jgi:hypothetical protein
MPEESVTILLDGRESLTEKHQKVPHAFQRNKQSQLTGNKGRNLADLATCENLAGGLGSSEAGEEYQEFAKPFSSSLPLTTTNDTV